MSKREFYLSDNAKVKFVTPADHSHFFGYYYHSPLSADKQYLLSHRTDYDAREIQKNDEAEIGYYDLQTKIWHSLGRTSTINWQIGSMLQWLGPNHANKVIFNDSECGKFISRIMDIETGEMRVIPHAIYDVHPSGTRALGVYFERHFFTREYHYENIYDERWNIPVHPDDGILDIDLVSGKGNLLIRTADIINIEPNEGMKNSANWLCHINWNPSGNKFVFLHRYGTAQNYHTRVFIFDTNDSSVICIPDHLKYNYSHLGWKNDKLFSLYYSELTPLASRYMNIVYGEPLLSGLPWYIKVYQKCKKILPTNILRLASVKCGYGLFGSDGKKLLPTLTKSLNNDGHPSWTSDGRYMLTDTYADTDGYRNLLVFDSKYNRVSLVGKFFSPHNESGFRCDLHPRIDYSNNHIIIDTAHSGKRQIMVLEYKF